MTEYRKVFIDTAPIIYYLQKSDLYFKQMKSIFLYLFQSGSSFITSDITIAEYFVYPYREKKENLESAFDDFISISHMEIVHTSEMIAKKAAKIRAEYKGFKAMDAIQLAVAEMSGCTLFLTNDKQLRQYKAIQCMTIDDMMVQITEGRVFLSCAGEKEPGGTDAIEKNIFTNNRRNSICHHMK